MRELRSAGTSVLLVEQSVNVAVAVADRVVVMDSGAIRFSGTAAEVRDQPELLWSIFLRGAANRVGPEPVDRPVRGPLRSSGCRPRPGGRPGRTGGQRGHGDLRRDRRPRRRDPFGRPGRGGRDHRPQRCRQDHPVRRDLRLHPLARGAVRLGGIDVTSLSAAGRARAGLGRSFQNSTLFAGLSVRDTLAVALERFIDTGDPVNAALRLPAMVDTEAAVAGRADELIELFGLERFADKFVSELSTGTRRLVDLAGVVAHAPSVVLLDEPTSGVAQREVEAMGELLVRVQHGAGGDPGDRRARHRLRVRTGRSPGGPRPGHGPGRGRTRRGAGPGRGAEAFLGTDRLARGPVRCGGPDPRTSGEDRRMTDAAGARSGVHPPLAQGRPGPADRARTADRGRADRRRGGGHHPVRAVRHRGGHRHAVGDRPV